MTDADRAPFFIGAGAYRHHGLASVDRLLRRGGFLTPATTDQPDISQETPPSLFEFQTQLASLTGMEVANAPLDDGATATAEAAAMAVRITKRDRVLISGGVHPQYAATVAAVLQTNAIEVECLAPDPLAFEDLLGRLKDDLACVILQNPSFFGHLHDLTALAAACRECGIVLVMVVTEPVSLGFVPSPGDMGADIVVGEGQSIGQGLTPGSPGLGLLATREKFIHHMPDRLLGQTSTKGQVSDLSALAFALHLALLGESGLKALAAVNHERAGRLADGVSSIRGVRLLPSNFFNEFAVLLPVAAAPLVEQLAGRGMLGGVPLSRFYPSYPELEPILLLAATETNSVADIDSFIAALRDLLP